LTENIKFKPSIRTFSIIFVLTFILCSYIIGEQKSKSYRYFSIKMEQINIEIYQREIADKLLLSAYLQQFPIPQRAHS